MKEEELRTCTSCKETKTLDLFYRHPRGTQGRMSKCKACMKIYEEEHREERQERQRRWRANNPSSRANSMLHTSKKGAKQRGLEFTLTKEWYSEKLDSGYCEVTGIKFVLNPDDCEHTHVTARNRRLNPFSPSVDRIDVSRGYTEDNCKMVCFMYNLCKQTFTDEAITIFAENYLKNG